MSNEESTMPLQQYSREVPPGWKPYSYPIVRYRQLLEVWIRLTKLDPEQIGPAILSRLGGAAWTLGHSLTIVRQEVHNGALVERTYKGVEAVCLPAVDATMHPTTGAQLTPSYASGAKSLIDQLFAVHYLDNQDRAWIALDQFFSYRPAAGADFLSYCQEWERLKEEACQYGGLAMNEIGYAYFFWSQSNVDPKVIQELRLKFDGDLTKWKQMVALQQRLSKSEAAITDQSRGYRRFMTRTEEYHMAADDDNYDMDYWYDEWPDYYNDDDESIWWYEDGDEEWWPDETTTAAADAPSSTAAPPSEIHYGGKGKGKGKKGKGKSKQPIGSQCTSCGSKFHRTEDCPLGDHGNEPAATSFQQTSTTELPMQDYEADWTDFDEYYGGKGKKGKRKGKSKSKRSPSSWWQPPQGYRKGKGRKGGKGKGKGSRWSGGKGRRYYAEDDAWDPSWAWYFMPEEPSNDPETFVTLMERQLPTSSREHSSPASSPQKRSPSRSSPGKAEDKKNKRTMEPERRQAEMHKLIGSIFGPPAATAPAPLASASPSLQPYATSLLPTASLFTPQHFRQEPFTPQPQTPLPQAQPFSSPLYSTSSTLYSTTREGYLADLGQPTSATTTAIAAVTTTSSSSHTTWLRDEHAVTTRVIGRIPDSFMPAAWCEQCQTPLQPEILHGCITCNKSYCHTCKNRHMCSLPSTDSWSMVSSQAHSMASKPSGAASVAAASESPQTVDEFCQADSPAQQQASRAQDSKTYLTTDDAVDMSASNLEESPFKAFQSIRGQTMCGLVVDPGASRGLIGRNTLKRIQEQVLQPFGRQHEVKWSKSKARFTGISAKTEHSQGLVTFPIGLNMVHHASFSADCIPGDCPALLPLQSLRESKAVLACNFYPKGDGLLLLHVQDRRQQAFYAPQVVRLTDSGHYLLPIDLFGCQKPILGTHKVLKHLLPHQRRQQPSMNLFHQQRSLTNAERQWHGSFMVLLHDHPDPPVAEDYLHAPARFQ